MIVLAGILLSSAMEIIGVGLIYGFARMVLEPSASLKVPFIENFGLFNSLMPSIEVILLIGIAIVALFGAKGVVNFLTVWARARFAGRTSRLFAQDLITHYAQQPYELLMRRHSSEFVKNVLSESEVLAYQVILPALTIVSEIIFVSLVLLFLFLFNPAISLGITGVFTIGYTIVFLSLHRRIYRAGQRRMELVRKRFKAAVEFFSGLREIKLTRRWPYFLHRFGEANRAYVRQIALLNVLPTVPSYSMQVLAVLCVVVIVVYLKTEGQAPVDVISTITLFAAAGWRIMPSFNSLTGSLINLRAHWPTLESFAKEDLDEIQAEKEASKDVEPMDFENGIALSGISYTYPESDGQALNDITIEIPKGASIGLVGPTGAGKSTLVEVLLGLLTPKEGAIIIDGAPLHANDIDSWQCSIGYVPQHIYLIDDSIRRNIAFGLADDKIDSARIEQAAKIAQIHDFIANELEDGYETKIGERGVRLSGGQLQRIGIARAVYSDPSLLVLDEATSALDAVNEKLVSEAIKSLSGRITTVIIAHRISTVRHCDQIYVLQAGKVLTQGRYEELLDRSETFRELAQSSNYPAKETVDRDGLLLDGK